jgi:hypothetical protein
LVEDFGGICTACPWSGPRRWENSRAGQETSGCGCGVGAVGGIGRGAAADEVGQRSVNGWELPVGARTLAGEEFGGDRANGVQVLAWIRIGARQLLGSQIARCTEDGAVARHARFVEQPGNTEVRQPQVRPPGSGDIEEEIGGLDVAMHDARRMHSGQAVQQLVQQDSDVRLRQRAVITE